MGDAQTIECRSKRLSGMDTLVPIAMAVTALVGILIGYRVAFVLAGSAALFIIVSELPLSFFGLIVSRIYANVLTSWMLVAIPMFIFMGLILERSGVAERALQSVQRALGGSPVGIGFAVLGIGLLMAASSGIVGASVVLLATLALPRLIEAGYGKPFASGLVASSGTLAILMPPSVMLIVLGDQLRVPIGDLFTAAILPSILLVFLYAAYVLHRGLRLARVGTARVTQSGQARALLTDVAPLVLLVLCVLGSIVGGLATPTEASGIGAAGAILIALACRHFSLDMLMRAARETVIASSMVLTVIIGATCFAAVFHGVGGNAAVERAFAAIDAGPWTILGMVMAAIFLLGFVLDWLEITMILMPIFAPLIAQQDFGNGLSGHALLIWFGVLVAVNLQSSFLTPPFGFALFYLRGAARDSLSTADIYRGVMPFVLLQLLGLVLLMMFPALTVGLI